MDKITEKFLEAVPPGHEIVDVQFDPFHPGTVTIMTQPGRGGFRPGAGRKPEGLQPVSYRLPLEVIDKIRRVADMRQLSQSKALAYIVRAYVDR